MATVSAGNFRRNVLRQQQALPAKQHSARQGSDRMACRAFTPLHHVFTYLSRSVGTLWRELAGLFRGCNLYHVVTELLVALWPTRTSKFGTQLSNGSLDMAMNFHRGPFGGHHVGIHVHHF